MTEPIKILSPTGCVHIAKGQHGDEYLTLCNQTASCPEFSAFAFRAWHHWLLTDKPVSCRRCLAKSKDPKLRLKHLAFKAADAQIKFKLLANDCEYIKIDINFLGLRNVCLHRHRLGTQKNPKFCNIIDCPLKYER